MRSNSCHGSSCTLEMAQSDRYKRLLARYEALTSRAAAGSSLVPDTAYADFLKEQERRSLPHTVPDRHPSPPSKGRGHGSPGKPRPLSANAIRERAQHSLEESTRRLKAIEDHMWQHRQQERELRRAEMDILKQRQHLQRQMRDFETRIARRQATETDTLLGKEGDLIHYQQKDLHQKEEATKERTQLALAGRQKVNEQTKKFMKTENELSWHYQNLLQSLERKRSEVEQLSKEFESKIRAKEEEQHRLKQELASLAITLNMEAQKRRHGGVADTKISNKTAMKEIMDSRTRADSMQKEERSKVTAGTRYENNKRDLEQSLKTRQGAIQARLRQEGRNLADVRTRLQHNTENQWYATQEAGLVQQDMIGQELRNKVQVVEAKRRINIDDIQCRKKQKNARELQEWERRIVSQENEARRREHEERLKQLSHVVSHHDGLEHALYAQAKTAEAQRKRQNQVVMKMQTDLEDLKRKNAKKLKEATIQAQKAEVELHQKITREAAELTKAANIREESLRGLAVHRHRTKEDRRMLHDEQMEHQRRSRIANRTSLLAQTT